MILRLSFTILAVLLIDIVSALSKNPISLKNIKTNQKAAVNIDKIIGCWQVVETGARKPTWQRYSDRLQIGQKNRSFQIFSKAGATFNNLSEYLGSNIFVYTDGTYKTIDKANGIIAASVTSINIVFFSLSLRFKVNGTGTIRIKYLDNTNRVFESEEGALVLQTKVDLPSEYKRFITLQ